MEELGRQDLAGFQQTEKYPFVFVLDSIRSLLNVGSVFRTADGFKAEGLVLCGFTGTPPHREIQKTALGATDSVRWHYEASIEDALHALKSQGFTIIALEQAHHSVSLEKVNFGALKKVAIVLGNEVEGVSDAALSLCDLVVEIPQFGTKHSFNVAVSAGIVGWEYVSSQLKNAAPADN
jgi:tRNA G18 (ribose-2'-O)-methylase SpoU